MIQTTAVINLYEQADRRGYIFRSGFPTKARDIVKASRLEREAYFKELVALMGGTLYTLFDSAGGFVYACGSTPELAAEYCEAYRSFETVWWSTERVRSCGGVRNSKEIFADAVKQNQCVKSNYKSLGAPLTSKNARDLEDIDDDGYAKSKRMADDDDDQEYPDSSAEHDDNAMHSRPKKKAASRPPKPVEPTLAVLREWPYGNAAATAAAIVRAL